MPEKTKKGLLLDMRIGESICFGVDTEKVIVILEAKEGQRARLRIQADPSVKVGRIEKQMLGR